MYFYFLLKKAKILTKPPPIDFSKLKKATGGTGGTHRAPTIPACLRRRGPQRVPSSYVAADTSSDD